jgi:flagellar biosynthetic protein FlhB
VADERDETERSEDPTQKKLDEALERGDVAKSQEVNTWFVLAAATLILLSFSGSMSAGITKILGGLIGQAHNIPVDGRGLLHTMQSLGLQTIAAIAVPFVLLVLAAIAGNMIQDWSSRSSRSWRRPTTFFNTANGTSGRRCRCAN